MCKFYHAVSDDFLDPCSCQSDDYLEYLRVFYELQIVSCDHVSTVFAVFAIRKKYPLFAANISFLNRCSGTNNNVSTHIKGECNE